MSCGCDNEIPADSAARCGNPCAVRAGNSATCELLPSQIENFTAAFFGSVVKSEVDGRVVWSLPCNLDTGFENNPRGEGEGLACYFQRLFSEGITGLTGPAGAPGVDGAPGAGAYTQTTAAFTEPPLEGSQTLTIYTDNTPAIIAGMYVYVEGSGTYLVDVADGTGALVVTLVQANDEVVSVIPAGAFVVPSGAPGPVGAPGPAGATGPAWSPSHSVLDYVTPANLDFDGATYQTITLSGVITFSTSNRGAGKTKILRIIGDSVERAFTFPGTWTFVGSAAPATIAANKVALLTLTAFGASDADIVASYLVSA